MNKDVSLETVILFIGLLIDAIAVYLTYKTGKKSESSETKDNSRLLRRSESDTRPD